MLEGSTKTGYAGKEATNVGIREDQNIGLNEWARTLLQGVVTGVESGTRVYADGRKETFSERTFQEPLVKATPGAQTYQGMFGDEYPLLVYQLPDGRRFEEYVQANPWSSGPMFFLALKDAAGNVVSESLWTDDQVNNG